jgi:hypothetical protein
MASLLSLFGAPADKDEPAIEFCGTAFAATAGPDSEGVGDLLDGVAQPNVFVVDKTGQTHAAGSGVACRLFLRHVLLS